MALNICEKDSRTVLLLGEESFETLRKAHVFVAGLGGVGGYALEQIVRAGIGHLTIVDSDCVVESNINRQLIADYSSKGRLKTDVFFERIKAIAPNCSVNVRNIYLEDENIKELLSERKPDYVIDAIDTLKPKVNLLSYCAELNIPVVSAMGAGGKTQPEMIRVVDVSETYNDGLSRMVRKRLHKRDIRTGIKAVFSPEDVSRELIQYEAGRNKKTNVGTISYMPAMFGLYCASTVIRDLLKDSAEGEKELWQSI